MWVSESENVGILFSRKMLVESGCKHWLEGRGNWGGVKIVHSAVSYRVQKFEVGYYEIYCDYWLYYIFCGTSFVISGEGRWNFGSTLILLFG